MASLISLMAYLVWGKSVPEDAVLIVDDYGTALPAMVYDDAKNGSISAKLVHQCGVKNYVVRTHPRTPDGVSPGQAEVPIISLNRDKFPCIFDAARKNGHPVQIEFRDKK